MLYAEDAYGTVGGSVLVFLLRYNEQGDFFVNALWKLCRTVMQGVYIKY